MDDLDLITELRERVERLESQVEELRNEHPLSSLREHDPGSRLALARNKARLTQHQLAEKAEVSPNTIINFENGRTKPRMRTMMALADALGVSHSYLQGGEDEH